MKHLHFYVLTIAYLTAIPTRMGAVDPQSIFGRSFFNPRPQGQYVGREMAGWVDFINQYRSSSYASGTLTLDGFRSFDKQEVGSFLFFNSINTMQFGDAAGPGVDVFEQNFLLNNDFQGFVTAHPSVSNIVVDFDGYVGLDSWIPGLYVRAQSPFCYTNWTMGLEQQIISTGTVIPAFSLGNTAEEPAPFNTIIDAWNGDATFFDVTQPLQYARIDGHQKSAHFADLEVALGYNIINCPTHHVGCNVRAIIPTGTRVNGIYLFQPIIGNGHHVELGGGLSAHAELWNCGVYQTLGIYFEGNLYHMFSTQQKRTFDLTENGIGSRYLLFKRFDGANIYTGEIVRGPNILTLNCKVRNAIHADAALMLHYKNRTYSLDGGYNVWARSSDLISNIAAIPTHTYGITGTSGTDPLTNRNRTASRTTISGENAGLLDGASNADNVYLSNTDLDISSAEHPNTFVHAFFIHGSYVWICSRYLPFLGAGAQIEFAGQHGRALKMWHLWLKGGFSL